MVVLFLDGFILLMYESLGKKEIVNKHHQSCLCHFEFSHGHKVINLLVFGKGFISCISKVKFLSFTVQSYCKG